MKGIILCLGAPNDDAGNLSRQALDRLQTVAAIYRSNPDLQIACTGGKGIHFNNTALPHYIYAHRYLLQQEIPAAAFTFTVDSANTAEDFRLSAPHIHTLQPEVLIVLTSDFHIPRARLLHNKYTGYPRTLFWPAPSGISAEEMAQLLAHEQRAIAAIEKS
ncbi:YdcF family protein [Chitinophaga sp. Mgbs1]|uniref:YdcF family protein n=1 Tax=Chitinophaga solisilvae TaxID=1233460 RepID=A0A433WBD4_9BACT|nr:YdcF family protein [Chitinophaga solisilvae]